MGMGNWHEKGMMYGGFVKNILKICITSILRKMLQSTCEALMGFGEVTITEESP